MTMLAAALLAMQGGSIHELQLDMSKRNVKEVIGALGSPDPDWTGPEQKFDVEGGTLFFCGERLMTFVINLTGELQAFSRAVNAETKARGQGTIKFQHLAWGAVETEWRIAPYQYLTLSIRQQRQGEPLQVERTLSRQQRCEAGVLK